MNVFLIDWSYSVFEYFNSGIMKIVILILCLDVLLENRTLTLCSGIKCISPIDVDSKPFEMLFLLKVPNLVLRFNWIDQFFQQTDLVFKTPILFLNIVKFLFQRLLAIIWHFIQIKISSNQAVLSCICHFIHLVILSNCIGQKTHQNKSL